MTTERYLPVSLHMNSNDLSKKAFFNFDNQTDCGWIQYTDISSFYIRNSNTTRYYNIVCKRKFTKE